MNHYYHKEEKQIMIRLLKEKRDRLLAKRNDVEHRDQRDLYAKAVEILTADIDAISTIRPYSPTSWSGR